MFPEICRILPGGGISVWNEIEDVTIYWSPGLHAAETEHMKQALEMSSQQKK